MYDQVNVYNDGSIVDTEVVYDQQNGAVFVEQDVYGGPELEVDVYQQNNLIERLDQNYRFG